MPVTIIDSAEYEKLIPCKSYPYGIKGQVLYFYDGNANDIAILTVRANGMLEFLLSSRAMGSYDQLSNAGFLKRVYKELERIDDGKEGERTYAYDCQKGKLIYNFTDKDECAWFSAFFPSDKSVVSFIALDYENKSLIRIPHNHDNTAAIAWFANRSQGLIRPNKSQGYGAKFAFRLMCEDTGVAHKNPGYIAIEDYVLPNKADTVVPLNLIEQMRAFFDIHEEEVWNPPDKPQEKPIEKDIVPINPSELYPLVPPAPTVEKELEYTLTEIVRRGFTPNVKDPVDVVVDMDLSEFKIVEVKADSRMLRFVTTDLNFFNSVANIAKLRDVVGMECIGVTILHLYS